jgi:ATP-dependent helicase/nuclease subunit A
MESGILTKYSASAGSGKTFKLTGIYLSKLFISRKAYRKILAVTFTNKAASDMKRKILNQLYNIAKGEQSDMSDFLAESTGKPFEKLREEAKEILENILHDYSGFFVGTIDSFFQKVLKAFTREIGLQHGYIIELDHSLILKHAVDDMLEGIGNDDRLRSWITDYSLSRIEDGKSWNLKDDIIKLAEEIFREKFKLLSADEMSKLKDREYLLSYVNELKKLKSDFEKELKKYSVQCKSLLQKHSVTDDMFLRGNKGGVPSFIKLMEEGTGKTCKPLTATVSQTLSSPPVWTTKAGPSRELNSALDDGFGSLFINSVKYYNNNFRLANTAEFILENIYILGILADILDHIHKITSAENRFLLSDAGELLYLITSNDQTPFIYEKVGNVYENFMIDEFQDTSFIQWNNFRPLIENSMSEGHDNLVVGDVKQSIYRWRNSDWKIFETLIHEQISGGRLKVEHLKTNWRSKRNIISFNNSLFSILPGQIEKSTGLANENFSLSKLYSDSVQLFPGKQEDGFINIQFLEGSGDKSYSETVLERLPSLIEEIQDNGYSGSDIGILVRTNTEGTDVLKYILDYQSSMTEERRKKYNFNIVSNESLLLGNSPAVCFIISLFAGLYDQDDKLSRALMLRNWLLATGSKADFSALVMEKNYDKATDEIFPPDYKRFIMSVRRMPLFESVENIILFFKLGSFPGNTAYLNSFQDCVLEFSSNISADITSFLDWWKTTGVKRSIILSDQQDSMRVMTIHKSKGLEFKVVIMPFISWNLGHGKNPTLWLNPARAPFNKLGLVPVKYKADLQYSDFETDYSEESYSAIVDSLNLLYVAFTRAVDCIFGFCPVKSKSTSVSSALYEALQSETEVNSENPSLNLSAFFNSERNVFSCGKIPEKEAVKESEKENRILSKGYFVSQGINRLYLKLHGESWLMKLPEEQKNRLNHGKIMHEVFESVISYLDIPDAVNKMVLEGKITEVQRKEIEDKIMQAVSAPAIRDWFKPGLEVMTEAEILTASGSARRPDRVIMTGEKVTIIDFKFGVEKSEYLNQVNNYRILLLEMGYPVVEAFIWYVDNNKVISA